MISRIRVWDSHFNIWSRKIRVESKRPGQHPVIDHPWNKDWIDYCNQHGIIVIIDEKKEHETNIDLENVD